MEADEHVIEKLHLAQDLTDFAEIYEGKVDLERKRYHVVQVTLSFCARGRIQNTDTQNCSAC